MSTTDPTSRVLNYRRPDDEKDEPRFVVARDSFRTALGLLAFGAALFLASLVAGLMVSGALLALLTWRGVTPQRANSISVIVMFAAFLSVFGWCVRELIRRASFQLLVFDDRIETADVFNRWVCPFEEIVDVRLVAIGVRMACVIVTSSGRRRLLQPDVADYQTIRRPFERWVLRSLSRRLLRDLKAGAILEVRDTGWGSTIDRLLGIPGAVCRGMLHGEVATPHQIVETIRNQIRPRGFALCKEGIIPAKCDPTSLIRWRDVQRVIESDAGLGIETNSGMIEASPYAHHYWITAIFLRERWRRLCDLDPFPTAYQ